MSNIKNHHFTIKNAKAYGVEKAVILNNLRFWLEKNAANENNVYNGYVWTYNSGVAFTKLFPYFSRQKVARLLRELESVGAIISNNFNTDKRDRTKWYSMPEFQIEMEKTDIIKNETNSCLKSNDILLNNEQTECSNFNHVYRTDNKHTDINTDKNTDKKHSVAQARPIEDARTVFDRWRQSCHHPQTVLDKKRKKLIGDWLKKGYSVEQLCQAVDGCAKTPFNMGHNDRGQRYDSLSLILRSSDHIDRFIHNFHNPPLSPEAKNKQAIDDWVNETDVIEGECT